MLELLAIAVCLECIAGALIGFLVVFIGGVLFDCEDVSDEDYTI